MSDSSDDMEFYSGMCDDDDAELDYENLIAHRNALLAENQNLKSALESEASAHIKTASVLQSEIEKKQAIIDEFSLKAGMTPTRYFKVKSALDKAREALVEINKTAGHLIPCRSKKLLDECRAGCDYSLIAEEALKEIEEMLATAKPEEFK